MQETRADLDVGEIIPPPEVQAVVDKTAAFVGLHGPAGERKIREKHGGTNRFSFLQETSPYNAYYQRKVTENRDSSNRGFKSATKASNSTEVSLRRSDSAAKSTEDDGRVDVAASTVEVEPAISKAKAAQVKEEARRQLPTEPPKPNVYTVNLGPRPPSAFQLDVMKLTAQCAAKQGDSFLKALMRRESRNPLFEFLRPLNRHFTILQDLINAFEQLVKPDEGIEQLVQTLKERGRSTNLIHEEVLYAYNWNLVKERNEKDGEDGEDSGVKNALIDWHDFVVLETISLGEDEDNLPPPIADPNQIPRVIEAAEKARKEQEQNYADVDMEIETENVEVVTADVNADIPVDRVRKDFVAEKPATPQVEAPTMVLPSGQRVPVDQADKSIRAELRDPKYKEERARAAEKNRLDNLASGDEIARNVAARNYQKTEVFNHANLRQGIASSDRLLPVQVAHAAEPVPAGPQLPSTRKAANDSAELEPPEKKARVEAAVGLLSAASKVASVEDAVDAVEVPQVPPGLVSEQEWIDKVGREIKISVMFSVRPNKDWKLGGKNLHMEIPLRKTIKDLKTLLSKYTKLPTNKQKLFFEPVGFMKDSKTFAYYNVPHNAQIEFEVKERGGKKR
eukprot:Plantae.Rhodophyta-Hildenbrandia_rubra.ctg15781.p1 GENE.Plantae.Rhodophyta-Hildenbrandia_rubra.ctg15781~~Plantae.Rhodophyta-Hildenbrandia_rubra.ctg15781.p1  ORF type:complete len:622 (+),score=114.27 Plantae.Rhodophyta-Hildenbrandia_rubra.ctg15781:301-2166(+)